MTKLITDLDEITQDFCGRIKLDWRLFEQQKNGNLKNAGFYFSMRLGLYLKRPLQAIILNGRFVKTRTPASYYSIRDLKTINPQAPHECLYANGSWDPYYTPPTQLEKLDNLILENAEYYNGYLPNATHRKRNDGR